MKLDQFLNLVKELGNTPEAMTKAMAMVDGTEIVDADGNPVDIASIELTTAPSDEGASDEGDDVVEESIERTVSDAVAKAIAKLQPAKQPERRTIPAKAMSANVRSFKGSDREFKAYAFGTWLQWKHTGNATAGKWLASNGVISKAQYENANAAGGALVPDEFAADLIRLVEEYGVARSEANVVSMSRETLAFPRRTGGLTASWIGEASSDSATAITKSDVDFANVNLVAKKLATLTLVSSELMEDAAVSIGDIIAREIAQAFAEAEDDACFNGDGTSTYGGVQGVLSFAGTVGTGASTVEAASGNTAFSTLDLLDFHKVTGALPRYAQANAKWYVSSVGFAEAMERLAHAQGGVTRVETEQGSQLQFLGYPVVITQKLNSTSAAQTSTKILAFGDLRQGVLFGDRRAPEVRTSEDRYFDVDQVAVRGIERIDMACHDFDSTSTAGPMIVLGTPSS